MEEKKILNTVSNRFIVVNGQRYKDLVKNGYYVNKQGNLTTDLSSKTIKTGPKQKSVSIRKTKSTLESVRPKSPIQTLSPNVFSNIVNELSPNDLLSLYITNKESLFTQDILNALSKKYKIDQVKSFTEFIKLYNLSKLEKEGKTYLYQLENNVEMPSLEFLTLFKDSKRNISKKMRAIVYDWLLQVNKNFKTSDYVMGLTMTLFDAYISKVDVDKDDLQTVSVVCHYLAVQVVEEVSPKISNYVYITDGATSQEKFENFRTHVIDTLNGVIIRPSIVFFIDMNNTVLKNLALLTYVPAKLMIYKPSLLAEMVNYLVTGEYKIYSLGEIHQLCRIFIPLIKNLQKSSLITMKKLTENLSDYINYECGQGKADIKESPFKYNKEWHIGKYKKLNVLGQGTYGKVVKIKRKACQTDFVIKKSTGDFEPALLELSVLKLLSTMKSDYVINLCGFQVKGDRMDLYLPFMNSTVEKLVDNGNFNINNFPTYAKQMLMGLHECHRCDLIHRDIKVNNIVYHEADDVFKIIDFGISVPYASIRTKLFSGMASTYPYRAPEALFDLKYNYKIDIWALGCVFYYIFTKKYIISEQNLGHDSDALNDIFKLFGTPTDQDWTGVNKLIKENHINTYTKADTLLHQIFGAYYDIVMPCFILNPANRPTTLQLLNNLSFLPDSINSLYKPNKISKND